MRHLLILYLPFEVLLPALETDLFLSVLPAAQAGQGNAGMSAKGLSSHPQLLSIRPDSLCLSIEKQLIILVQGVGDQNPVELRQVQNQTPCNMPDDTTLNFNIHTTADTGELNFFPLHQPFAVYEPPEPVRDGGG